MTEGKSVGGKGPLCSMWMYCSSLGKEGANYEYDRREKCRGLRPLRRILVLYHFEHGKVWKGDPISCALDKFDSVMCIKGISSLTPLLHDSELLTCDFW